MLILGALLVGCGGQGAGIPGAARRVMDPPADLPKWSESQYVRWASVKAATERAVIIDVTGGEVDRLLDEEPVTGMLNEHYRTLFLHPRARPWLTERVGWPTVLLLSPEGCVRELDSPSSAADFAAMLEKGLAERTANDKGEALPPPRTDVPKPPEGGGTWTADAPDKAAVFVQPERGAPAVIFEDRPWVYGNRTDATLLKERPAARAFLDSLPENDPYLWSEGPVFNCPLKSAEPPPPPPAEEDAEPKDG